MADHDLRFSAPRDTSPPYDLVFGGSSSGGGGIGVTISATLPAPTLTCELMHDNAVFRGIANGPTSGWQDGTITSAGTRTGMQDAQAVPSGAATTWGSTQPAENDYRTVMQHGIPVTGTTDTAWQEAVRVSDDTATAFRDLARTRAALDTIWQEAEKVRGDVLALWQDGIRSRRQSTATGWGAATPLHKSRTAPAGSGVPLFHARSTEWEEAMKPPPGYWNGTPIQPPVDPPCYTPPPGGAVPLLFRYMQDGSTNLLFICRSSEGGATVIIPPRRAYIVLNDVRLVRVDGSIELPAISLALNIDADSWTFGFSAVLPRESLDDVMPASLGAPVEIDAEINGEHYRLLVESITRDRQFASTRISVSGRGISAWLADPYSPTLSFLNTEARTAQQLMGDVLTTNGASLGWTVDWQIDDWLVPGGAWSHQGSYMRALTTIAEAAGAYIQPHPNTKVLRVLPRYPVKPWEWGTATPDIELPSAVVTRESIRWEESPAYNAVYVTGTQAGIVGQVKRTGSAGDVIAPMVSDPLITQPAAARQRGIAVLGKTGRIATVGLSLPVLPATGVILPGKTVRYVDGSDARIGVVRSASVDAALPSVRQTIEVECSA